MANKMIIDASHPEETRVVVLRGNRVEEFDFESANKKPLRGNIYLAKVTRVEPSLQAAFVDYGGNRHGFLAFSEIHPDYYQIPVADRQALLEEDAHVQDEDEDHHRGDRRSRRHRRPRSHEAELRADSDERVSEQAEIESAAEGDEASPSEPNFERPATSEAEAAVGEVAPAHDDEAASIAAAGEQADESSEPAHVAAHEEEAETAVSNQAEPAEDEADENQADESSVDEATSHEAASHDETPIDAASERLHEAREEAPHDDEAAESDEHHDDDHGEITTLDGGEEFAPQARRTTEDREDEGEPVEQIGGDAMEELPRRPPRMRRQYKIQEVIKRRQVLLVQVVKEERGNKGAALTTYLSLAGRYSVLMPNTARGGGISRKITNSADRSRLKSIAQDLDVPEGMGVILRTAGAMRTKAEVKRDFEYLLRMWETVREKTLASTAPMLVYEEGSLIKRAIRDLYNKDIDDVTVAGDEGYREAKEFMRLLMPSHAKNVTLYRDPQPIFAKAGVEAQLDALFSNQVTLKSGGYLVINQTEALVAIDVNSGRSTREHNIEDTAVRTNLEAADEVARQLRLRDLAGLIVVDFIDMEEGRNNRAVERRIKDALKNDRARIQVGRISHFGLLEMSRQRIRTGMLEGSTVICAHCMGAGVVRSTASIALHVLRVIEDALLKSAAHDLNVRTRTEVALYILNQKRSHLRDLERRFGVTVMVLADDSLAGATYHAIERGEPAAGVKLGEAEARALPPPIEEIEEAEIDAEIEEEEDAEGPEDDGELAGEAEGQQDGAQRREREDGDGSRRRRRRRRRRGGREPSDVAADAPQPTDAGLAAVAEIDEQRNVRSREGGGGSRDEHSRRSRWRRDGRDRPRRDEQVSETQEQSEATPDLFQNDQVETGSGFHDQAPEPAAAPPSAEHEPEAAETQAAEPAASADEAHHEPEPPATPSAPEPEHAPEPEQPPRPKRSGWWQRARATFVGE